MHHGLENKTIKETEPNIAKIFRVLKKHTKSEQVYQKLSPKQSYLRYGNSAYDQYAEDKLLCSVGCLPMIVKLKTSIYYRLKTSMFLLCQNKMCHNPKRKAK